MSYKIDQATVQLNTIDRKLFRSNIPVILSLLIFIGLTADSARRIMESSFREVDLKASQTNADNFERDLNSFSDSDNAAGFLTALEDELSTIVTFEPKLPELRSAMATLFHDFNENISDWSEDEIPNVEAFKIRIAALTENIDAVSDDNLLDVLRLVKDEIDSFSAQTKVWANSLGGGQFDPSMTLAMLEILGGAALIIGSMAVMGKVKNGLVQERYGVISMKEEAIREIVMFKEIPVEINSLEDAKDALLKLLIEIGVIFQSYSYKFSSYPTWYKENLITLYDLPADDIGHTFGIIKDNLEKFFNKLRNSHIHSYRTDNRLREYISTITALEKRYREIAAEESDEAEAGEAVVVPVTATETNQKKQQAEVESEKEPALLRVINANFSILITELIELNRSLPLDITTVAFGQSVQELAFNFTKAVEANNRKKAIEIIERMIGRINRLKNQNMNAAELMNKREGIPFVQELESFLESLAEVEA